MSLSTDPQVALSWVIRIAACGVLIDAAQRLVSWRVFHDTGALGWPWLRMRRRFLRRRWFDAILGFPAYMTMLALRIVATLALLANPLQGGVTAVALPTIVLTSLLTHLRMAPYGLDGAHRMTLVIFGSLTLWRLAPDSSAVDEATLWFIALQGCLSYTTAGWVKAFVPEWRRGTATFAILNVPVIVRPAAPARWFSRHRLTNRAATWSTLAMECAFPLVLVAGYPGWMLFLGWATLFHLGTALVLGLNTFVWAWAATYPAIIYVATHGF